MQVKWLVLTLHIIMSRLVQTAESLAGYRAVGKFVFINTMEEVLLPRYY